jgi:acylaminoacyl-peptidase
MAGTSDYVNTAMGTDPVELRAQSPIHNLDKIKSPIMIIHGKVDLRTPFDGAKRFVAALKKTDVDFEYHWYNHEGHGLYFNKNSSDQFKKVNRFLDSCDARPPLNPKVASR